MNVALIGAGRWGPRLIPKLLDHCEVTDLCCFDIDEKRSVRVAKEYPTVRVASDYSSILNDPKIEALIIATPAGSHYSLAEQALRYGKNVLVEKPLTIRVSDAEHLVELADRRNLKLMVDHITVYSGAVQAIKKLINSGELGRLLFMDATRVSLGIFQADVSVVWDLAVHEAAMIDHVFAEGPIAVSATGSGFYGPLEEVVHATLFFDDGLLAHVYVSWLSPLKSRRVVIGGMNKMLVFDDMLADGKISVYDRGVDRSVDAETGQPVYTYRERASDITAYDCYDPMSAMIDDFITCIDEDREPLASGKTGLEVVRVLEAVEKSIREQGASVRVAR
jgi:predicted dehydrogenase